MPARFTVLFLLANIVLLCNSYAQQATCPPVSTAQIVSDVVVSGATVDDGYGGWTSCGVRGRVYCTGGRLNGIQRVSPDGSTLVFALPDDVWPAAIAPAGSGLNILTSQVSRTERRRIYEMYHFDEQANIVTHRRLHMTFSPERMAVTSSGRAAVVGHSPTAVQNGWINRGAELRSVGQPRSAVPTQKQGWYLYRLARPSL